jgi:hypothetical protein
MVDCGHLMHNLFSQFLSNILVSLETLFSDVTDAIDHEGSGYRWKRETELATKSTFSLY